MSTKINMQFMDLVDYELNKKLPHLGEITRLVCCIKFKTTTGWTKAYSAIFDTGAHTSVIPLSIWQDIETEILGDHKIHGVIQKEECYIPVKFGCVTIILLDPDSNSTKAFEVRANMPLIENVPLLLGFRDLLSKFSVFYDYEEDLAFIEEK